MACPPVCGDNPRALHCWRVDYFSYRWTNRGKILLYNPHQCGPWSAWEFSCYSLRFPTNVVRWYKCSLHNGWVTRVYVLFNCISSHQDNWRVIMQARLYATEPCLRLKRVSAIIEHGTATCRSVGWRLTHWATWFCLSHPHPRPLECKTSF